uniref:Heterogeneous nuclear ribonucleoprotein A1 n=1 Tax=Panagrellus redivivus TaxID=6233 RepID=A0A7E4V7U2_PANRE
MVKEEVSDQSSNGNSKQDEQYRKLFIGGLSMQTTDETLKSFYEQYGTVSDCVVMKDPHTRRSRGFGFVTYKNTTDVDAAMKSRPHVVDGKTVDPKRAVPREASAKNEANISTKRLYISGVRDDNTEQELNDYFTKFGSIEKVEIIKDKNTGKCRGFAFVTFDDYDPVDKACLDRSHHIGNNKCDVKKALSKEEIAKAQQMDRDRAERSQRSRGTARSGGPNNWGGPGGDRGGNSWSSQSAGGGGYGVQAWGGAPQSGGYGGYSSGPASAAGGWSDVNTAQAWGPPAGGPNPWNAGGAGAAPGGWSNGGGVGGYGAAPSAQQPWSQQPAPGGWGGGGNSRQY